MEAFFARHPETGKALTVIKGQPVSSGFGNSTFHGLNAFRFINSAGDSIPVRWLMTQCSRSRRPAPVLHLKTRYLFDALIAAIHRQPLQWRLVVIIGQPGDPTNDASVAWPAERRQVDVGT